MDRSTLRRLSLVLFAFLALLASLGEARAGTFTPGHLFVGSALGRVFEFDPSGSLVRTIQVAPVGNMLRGVTFDPFGQLWVADQTGDAVYRVSHDEGSPVLMWDSSDGLVDPVGLSFGPRGGLGVVSRGTSQLVVFASYFPHSPPDRSIPLPGSPSDAVFDARGDLLVTSNLPTGIHRVHANGTIIASHATGLSSTGGLGFWHGAPVLSDYGAASIHSFYSSGVGSGALTHPQIVGPWGVAASPRGHLAIACHDTHRVVEISAAGIVEQVYEHPDLTQPTHLAFAPYLFLAKVKGEFHVSGQPPKKVKGDGYLTYAPGTGTASLLGPILNEIPSLSSGSATNALVLRGADLLTSTEKKRVLTGAWNFEDDDFLMSRALSKLSITGKVDGDGTFRPKSVKGTIEAAGIAGRVTLKVTAKKQIDF